jgi:hypothetical protein
MMNDCNLATGYVLAVAIEEKRNLSKRMFISSNVSSSSLDPFAVVFHDGCMGIRYGGR